MAHLKPSHLRALLSLSSSLRPPSLSVFICRLSTSPGFPSHSHPPSRRQEEESRSVRVLVWWDLENCHVPAGANGLKVAHMVTAAVRANGIKGPVQITAFGDVLQLPRATQEAFSYTGINLAHVPRGGKNGADRSIVIDIMHWVSQNPPPAHLFLISGDKDFASVLHRLRMNNYNILLASPESDSTALCSAASIMWHWNALINGENLIGRHFNHPPDGPYGSWYGPDRVPLEDPFSVEQTTCTQAEQSAEAVLDSKVRPIPKAVIKQIQHILSCHPKGISITDLRSELDIDKDFYGYKKFARFLASMGHILRLQTGPDGQLHVRRITPRAAESSDIGPSLVSEAACRDGEPDLAAASKLSDNEISVGGPLTGKSVRHPSPVLNSEATQVKLLRNQQDKNELIKTDAERPSRKVLESLSDGQKVVKKADEQFSEGHLVKTLKSFSASEGTLHGKVEQIHSNGDTDISSDRLDANEKETASGVPESSRGDESNADKKQSVDAGERKTGQRAGFFSRIFNWFRFWRHGQDDDSLGDPCSEKPNQRNNTSQMHEVFTKDSFWDDIRSFMDSSKASVLVSQSRTRKGMVENLLREGPVAIKSLSNNDLLQFVDLLISDKKWVEECSSQMFPFRVKTTVEKSSDWGHHAENVHRSIVEDKSNYDSQREPFREKSQNVPHTRVSAISVKKSLEIERSRSEILADCQKLVKDILKEHPEGYNIVLFRSLFLERYGYPLATQKLGYKKLTSLLEIMPGVKIESNYLLPLSMAPNVAGTDTSIPEIQENVARHSVGNSNGDSSKNINSDSPWDELGPVSDSSLSRKKLQSESSRAIEESRGQTFPEYEPSLSEDELSDMEDEASNPRRGAKAKAGEDGEDSSLLQILDSWYNTKEDGNGEEKPGELQSKLSGQITKIETSSENYQRRQKPQKSYSFVADPAEDNKDKLIDGILGGLKKPGYQKSRAQRSETV